MNNARLLLVVASMLVLSLGACSRSAPPADTKPPAAAGAQRTDPVAAKGAAALAQTPLEKGMADRMKRNEAACKAGDPNGCAYPMLAKKFQELRVDCDRGDDGACRRLFNTMRNEDDRTEFEERCEAGYTRGCLILAEYYLVISPDTAKVAEYQALAESQLKAARK